MGGRPVTFTSRKILFVALAGPHSLSYGRSMSAVSVVQRQRQYDSVGFPEGSLGWPQLVVSSRGYNASFLLV